MSRKIETFRKKTNSILVTGEALKEQQAGICNDLEIVLDLQKTGLKDIEALQALEVLSQTLEQENDRKKQETADNDLEKQTLLEELDGEQTITESNLSKYSKIREIRNASDAASIEQTTQKKLEELDALKAMLGETSNRHRSLEGSKSTLSEQTAAYPLDDFDTRMSKLISELSQGPNKEPFSKRECEEYQKRVTDFHCNRSREIAEAATKDGYPNGELDDKGKNFTNHTEKHLQQVFEKTNETADALIEASRINRISGKYPSGDVRFSDRIDRRVLDCAALSHDMGMSNEGYAYINEQMVKQNPYNFDEVRKNHSLNSALRVLENRNKLVTQFGLTNEQVDRVALECFAHSKSASGIRNLNCKKDWETGIKTLEKLVAQYKVDHQYCGKEISFLHGREFLSKEEKLRQIATETLALRVGDVSRDSGPDDSCQSGETVHVDKKTGFNFYAKDWMEEAASISVTRNGIPINHKKSIQVHAGEQNIIANRTYFDSVRGIVHEITVSDGNYAPLCTFEAIKDHAEEFGSAVDGSFSVDVFIGKDCDPNNRNQYVNAYEGYLLDLKRPFPQNVSVRFIP